MKVILSLLKCNEQLKKIKISKKPCVAKINNYPLNCRADRSMGDQYPKLVSVLNKLICRAHVLCHSSERLLLLFPCSGGERQRLACSRPISSFLLERTGYRKKRTEQVRYMRRTFPRPLLRHHTTYVRLRRSFPWESGGERRVVAT